MLLSGRRTLLVVCACVSAWIAPAQDARYMEIRELDSYTETLAPEKRKFIVDINSRIDITLNREELIRLLGSTGTSTDAAFLEKLRRFNKLIRQQQNVLQKLNTPGELQYGEFDRAYLGFRQLLRSDFPDLKARFDSLYNNAPADRRIRTAFTHFLDGYELRRDPVRGRGVAQKVSIKAELKSARYGNSPVHVTNYDNVREKTFWQVSNWQEPGEEEKREMEQLVAGIDNIDRLLDGVVRKTADQLDLGNTVNDLLNLPLDQVDNLVGREQQEVIGLRNRVLGNLRDITEQINRPLSDATVGELSGLVEQVSSEAELLKEKLDARLDAVPELAQNVFNPLLDRLTNVIPITLKQLTEKIVVPARAITKKGEETANRFYSYKVEEAPQRAYIDLNTVGKRANFDQLQLDLKIQDAGETDPDKAATIERVTLSLIQVRVHAKASVGTILANSFEPSERVRLEQSFQLAPSLNFVFKWGSRSSAFVNFTQPGIGINISTPDFDLNGVPDFSFGLVGTLFRDVLSLGVAYNTAVDVPFWFIGFSLPITGVSLPVLSNAGVAADGLVNDL